MVQRMEVALNLIIQPSIIYFKSNWSEELPVWNCNNQSKWCFYFLKLT